MNQWLLVIAIAFVLFMIMRPRAPLEARLSPSQFREALAARRDAQLVDVRTPEEFRSGHLAGAVNIPLGDFGSRLASLKPDRPLLLYCHSGNRSGSALGLALKGGFPQAKHLEGGISAWQGAGYPVVR